MTTSGSGLGFTGRVAVITGAGGGLGREYALLLASRGAAVVVNDLGGNTDGVGANKSAADIVVQEIVAAGGKAVANYDSVENGDAIIKSAIDNFGRVDIVINNAGILRDKSFLKLTEQDWDLVHRVHLKGSYSVTKAAWPYFREQNFGRIIFTSSGAGIYGNFGQANYSSAKLGLLGLSNTLAVEGSKYNIHSNTIVPVAASRLTEDIIPADIRSQLLPKHIAPVVAYLCHEHCTDSGLCIEASGGWIGRYKLQRSVGKAFIPPETLTPESVRDNWRQITDMSAATSPDNIHQQMGQLLDSLSGKVPQLAAASTDGSSSSSDNELGAFKYDANDAILYALGVGVSTDESHHLNFLYENSDNFSVLPTFGVIPGMRSLFDYSVLDEAAKANNINFDPSKLLHGEQYLEVLSPVPASAKTSSTAKVLDVLDKQSGAVVIAETETKDASSGAPLFYNQFSLFLVGSGNFNGKRASDNKNIKNIAAHPQRPADKTVLEKTTVNQAALYRLSGDKNPLHIDPVFSAMGGFNKPILHGLCTLGFAVRHVLKEFGDNDARRFRAVKARFTGSIIPGETIRTELWRENDRIYFECFVQETGKSIISGAYVDLLPAIGGEKPLAPSADNLENDFAMFYITDAIFEEIGRRVSMASNLSKDVGAIFQFNILDDGKIGKVWTLDMRSAQASAYPGEVKNDKPNCVIDISDEDMAALALGSLDPVKAFMNGQIKIKGNPMLTQKLNILFKLDSANEVAGVDKTIKNLTVKDVEPEKLSKIINAHAGQVPVGVVPVSYAPAAATPAAPAAPAADQKKGPPAMPKIPDKLEDPTACKTDIIFSQWLVGRLDELKELIPSIKTVYQWNITKKGKVQSVWTCDFKNGDGAIHQGPPKTGRAQCTLTLDDEDAVKIFQGKEDAMRAFMAGKLKISGNILAAQKLQQLWAEEAPNTGDSSDSGNASGEPVKIPDQIPLDDIESIPCSGLKCDLMFNVFRNRCHEEPDFMKRLRVVFQFNITRNGKPICVWTADNKTQPEVVVYRKPPVGTKADCTVTVDDEDMLKILIGKVNPQRLFMMGKVKVRGNIMLLQKLNSLWIEYQKLGKTPELPIVVDLMMKDPIKVGLKSEAMFIDLMQRVVKLPDLPKMAPGNHQFNITKDGKLVSQWTLDFATGRNTFRRGTASDAISVVTIDDTDLARLVFMKVKLPQAIDEGILKLEKGSKENFMKLEKLFTTPTSLRPKL